ALERGQHRLRVAAAERHDVDGGKPQIGGHAHLRNRDQVGFDHRIMHLAADEHLGKRMADELADAELALRSAPLRLALMMTSHCSKAKTVSPSCPGLTRASTSFSRRKKARRGWAGQDRP